MKALKTAFPITLFSVFAITPLLRLIALMCGVDFVLYSEPFICILQLLVSIAAVTLCYVYKPRFATWGNALIAASLPFAAGNCICLLNGNWGASPYFSLVCTAGVIIVYAKFIPDSGFRALTAVASVLLATAFVALAIWSMISGIISVEKTVESNVESIDGEYYAEIAIEKTLLGAKTVITVKPSDSSFGFIIGAFWEKDYVIYEGEDYIAKTASVNWLDERTLVINGTEYYFE